MPKSHNGITQTNDKDIDLMYKNTNIIQSISVMYGR